MRKTVILDGRVVMLARFPPITEKYCDAVLGVQDTLSFESGHAMQMANADSFIY